jgi:hypothetical protein
MSKKSLYDKNDRYTTTGLALGDEITGAIADIITKYIALGYSAREVSHIAQDAVACIEVSRVLDPDHKVGEE